MSTIHRYRSAVLSIAAVLSVVLVVPVAAQALDQEQNPLTAPAGPSWDDTSGYGAVEANRALIGHDNAVGGQEATGHEASAALAPSWDETSGYGAVESSRAVSPEDLAEDLAAALASGRRGESLSGDRPPSRRASRVITSAWDAASGYGTVEASRAGR